MEFQFDPTARVISSDELRRGFGLRGGGRATRRNPSGVTSEIIIAARAPHAELIEEAARNLRLREKGDRDEIRVGDNTARLAKGWRGIPVSVQMPRGLTHAPTRMQWLQTETDYLADELTYRAANPSRLLVFQEPHDLFSRVFPQGTRG